MSVVISEQLITGVGMPCFFCFGILNLTDHRDVVIKQVHIQITVTVKVKEGSMGSVSRIVQTKLWCLIRKRQVPVVNKQFISPFFGVSLARVTNIDVKESVAVYIGHGNTGFPAFLAKKTR